MKHLHVPDRDPEWRKLCHIDAVLLAWYSLIQHLLLDDSTPDDESTYDVITRLRRSEEGFFYGFNDLMAGFDYRTYKEMPQGHDAKNVEPIRAHHHDCFLKSYSANDFGLSEEKFRELVDIMSFFISRTLFATNQLATLLLLQASLPLIVGRLFTDELFGKQHLFSVLNFAKMVTDQLRYQTDEIKTILLDGWQSNRRHEKNSTWCNLGPLDNFRLAMQAKKDIDKLLYDIDFLVEQMREQVAKTQISNGKTLRSRKAARTFQVRRNGNSNGFSTTRNFPPPCDRLDCLQQKFQSDPGKRKALGEKLMGSTWLDMPFFPTQPILEFGYVWILLFVLLNVTSAGKNSPLPSAPKSGGAVLMAVQDGTGTRVWFLTVQM